jgi:DNA-binding GntR family transcriptional regulator
VIKLPQLPEAARTMARDHAYRLLRQHILSGQIPGGERLVEEDLANQLGISRTPVREALRRLESDGLVRRLARGRLVATTVTDRDRENFHAIRVAIDEVAARLACKHAEPESWAAVLGLIDVLEATLVRYGRSSPHFAIAHLEVHMRIHRVAFGDQGVQVLGHPLLYLELPTDDYVQQDCSDPAAQHRALVAELASGDEARAVKAALAHAERSRP